jgi:hypothetical protein
MMPTTSLTTVSPPLAKTELSATFTFFLDATIETLRNVPNHHTKKDGISKAAKGNRAFFAKILKNISE